MILTLFPKSQETLEYQIWTKNGLFALYLVKQSINCYYIHMDTSLGWAILKKKNTLFNERGMHFITGGAITFQ